jgi:D-glycero-D-manno-heptose 1,7-bisphosphate phosphatase
VFIDRDGTLNEERGFIRRVEDFELIPGAAGAVRKLNNRGIPTCIISNQSGVARGYLSEEDLVLIHAKLRSELEKEKAWVDRIYYCPHHPAGSVPPYNIECDCRKPRSGMMKRGETELQIDLARSFVIGDKPSDVKAGKGIGATSILVLTGYGEGSLARMKDEGIVADFIAPSIVEAVEFILRKIDDHVEGSR